MGRETQPLNQHFFFSSLPSLSLSLLDREDTLHDRGGRGSRPGKVYLFIHH